ncbi:MAG: hypothetical protein AAF357_19725 [Verrucomicrobiota bacterium]
MLAAPVGAATGSREAMRILEEQIGPHAVLNLVAIIGFDGDDQPDVWRLLCKDPRTEDIFQEFAVEGETLSGPTAHSFR